MGDSNASNTKTLLKEHLRQFYGFRGGLIERKDFLHTAWAEISSLIQRERNTALVHEAVKEYTDLIPRAYVLLTLQYGAFAGEPDIIGILKDLVELLDRDLTEEEMRICEYARQVKFPYFHGLIETWEGIQHVYRAKYFDLKALPPSPHIAYALLTLNDAECIGKKMSPEEMFGKLSVFNEKMHEIHDTVRASQISKHASPAKIIPFKPPLK